ncbi:MAG: hypothetical protein HYY04_04665 [Chloroflexi bacterium]|nr:hypothetical protein [Chloroflexota bacterium]
MVRSARLTPDEAALADRLATQLAGGSFTALIRVLLRWFGKPINRRLMELEAAGARSVAGFCTSDSGWEEGAVSRHQRRQPVSPWASPVRRALREGKVVVGALSISFPCPAVAQIYGQAGFSFIYFDMEHSGMPIQAVEPICTAAKLAGLVPLAGTTGIADFLISRPLDNGAMGVIAPHVGTREETELVVNASRYPPLGTRDVIDLGALNEFVEVDPADWLEVANRETLVAVKVESARGVDNVEEIAAVPGLDAILVGPTDLTASMGIVGQFDHPRYREAMERVLAACRRHGIAGGLNVATAEAVREWVDRGATFVSCGFDGPWLLETSRSLAERARHLLGDRML